MHPKKKLTLINLGLDPKDFEGFHSEDFYSQISSKLKCSREQAKKLCYKAMYSNKILIN